MRPSPSPPPGILPTDYYSAIISAVESPRDDDWTRSPFCYGGSPDSIYQDDPDFSRLRIPSPNTPTTEQNASTPGPLTPAVASSVANRLSIDSITNAQPGSYVCTFSGCTAPPFQTQYLLNSHVNVHDSRRPHYCPVQGCPRAEGGKGFKRKTQMIRHGLVHDSPGYVCPFCPDREHKYLRPDNLQRYIATLRDDPLLKEVLSQRPDTPSRGRRRRG
ncbi:hypothetical protein B0J13DRAFT_447171, partial [Dactylonectria estremocensis]